MKRLLALFSVLSIFFLLAGQVISSQGQEPMEEKQSEKIVRTGPVIQFESKTQDLGEVSARSRTKFEFKFKNAGSEELKIQNVKRTCGCTVVNLSKKNYLPGETGAISGNYSASSRPGRSTKHIYVSTNDPENQRVKLTISALVASKVRYDPDSLNLILNKENAGCPEITLESKDDSPFAIKRILTTGNCIDFKFDPSKTAKKFVLKPTVDLDKLRKVETGKVYLHLSHKQCKQVAIPYNVLLPYKAQPPGLALLDAKPGEVINRNVWILSNYDEEFEIESFSSEAGYVKCKNEKEILDPEKKSNRYNLELEITPPRSGRKRGFRDTIYVKAKDGEKLEITCFGLYRKE